MEYLISAPWLGLLPSRSGCAADLAGVMRSPKMEDAEGCLSCGKGNSYCYSSDTRIHRNNWLGFGMISIYRWNTEVQILSGGMDRRGTVVGI